MHSASSSASSGSAADGYEGRWWHTDEAAGRIVCDLCPRECHLKPGDRAFCFVRENRDGRMVLSTYGRSTGFCIDPIEKKPLNHFYPGTSVLSFGTAGCNLGCKFCQNWDISKSREVERLSQSAEPDAIAEAALELGCKSVAFTYNDPVVWAEYAIDTARACRERGVKTVAVTAGYITPQARGPFYEFMDAANVDLKAFTEEFYWKLTQAHLQPVLDTLIWLKRETDVWFELTNLVIPQANDASGEFHEMCDWVLDNLGDEVPLHFTAFHPDFRMMDRPPTPHETLLEAHAIARRRGLKFVYVGNVVDRANGSTYCPNCGELLIERDWHEIGAYRLDGDRCSRCQTQIPGRFDRVPGNWGRKRMAVDMSRFSRQRQPSGLGLPIITPPQTATKPMSTMTQLDLSDAQRTAIHRLASDTVAATVCNLPVPQTAAAGLASMQVWGAFVTLKRCGNLRGCCGHLGHTMSVVEAVTHAAARTAVEDLRLPRVSPSELEFLDLDVTLLHNLQPVGGSGEFRAEPIEPGRHGVRIQRGQASGLFLPQVAREHGWDRDTLLREICVKAGLPTTAWKQDETQLWTFEGLEIDGPFATTAEIDAVGGMPHPTAAEHAALVEHCRQTLGALVTGAVALSYLPGGYDGQVNGLTVALQRADGHELMSTSQFELLKSLPLQMTAYQMLERLAAAIGRQPSAAFLNDHRIALTIYGDPAMHGSVAEPDLRGFDPARRSVLVGHRGALTWACDPSLAADEVLNAATASLRDPQHASIFSLATVTNSKKVWGTTVPRPQAGRPERPAAVAGAFYPADPEQLARLVDDLLGEVPARPQPCAAVMLPHAGYRFSGRIAGQTLAQVEIPDRVIVIGPKHTPHGVDWAVAPHDVWQLPGGGLRSDPELARRLAAEITGLELDAEAHREEHGIEVELPFIHRLAPQAQVVGIVMGSGSLEACREFGRQLAEVIRTLPRTPLLVISSDMNHYATDAENRELDALALSALDTLDPAQLLRVVRRHHISMCGVLPAVVVLEALHALGRAQHLRHTGYATSADASGDTSRVVGYAGVIIDGE
jgi:AmmeMemoRadiSam system radical SAM enzyme/AmmeMemoRadiSam system protein B/AmmeMemoRadiSam system protein A